MIALVVAMAQNGVIGAGGSIPWRIPGEQAYFKQITLGHSVVMGRKTYESIGRPLPERTNFVLSRDDSFYAEGCQVVHDVEKITLLGRQQRVFVIGGTEVFRIFLPQAELFYQTLIEEDIHGDTFFPAWDSDAWQLISTVPGKAQGPAHRYNVYRRRTSGLV